MDLLSKACQKLLLWRFAPVCHPIKYLVPGMINDKIVKRCNRILNFLSKISMGLTIYKMRVYTGLIINLCIAKRWKISSYTHPGLPENNRSRIIAFKVILIYIRKARVQSLQNTWKYPHSRVHMIKIANENFFKDGNPQTRLLLPLK